MKHEGTKASRPVPAEDAVYAALGRSKTFGEYRWAFREATGLHVGLLSAHGVTRLEQILHDSPLASRSFCALMARSATRCLTCLEEQQKVASRLEHEAVTFECFPGLRRRLLPVRAADRLIALLQSGPSLPHRVTSDELCRHLRALRGKLRGRRQHGGLRAGVPHLRRELPRPEPRRGVKLLV